MPELPDVQVFKEYLDSTALHQQVAGAHLFDASELVREGSPDTIRRRLKGASLASTRRHGKHLFAEIEEASWLRLHFGMTGELKYYKGDRDEYEHTRLRLDFENGYRLAYVNVRKLGEIGLVDDVDEFVREEGLGPDALDASLDPQRFVKLIEPRRGTVKGTLMNQEVLAGIGNIYADEILFDVGLFPKAAVDRLRDPTIEVLFHAMVRVLGQAVDARVEPDRFPASFLLPHRKEGVDCPRCGGTIKKIRVSGRATYYCGYHQRRRT